MEKFKNNLQRFLYSNYYLIALAIFTIISWQFNLDSITFVIIGVIIILEFIFLKDAMPTVPAVMAGLFLASNIYNNLVIPFIAYLAPVAALIAMIIHIVKNKQKLFQGKLLVSMIILFIAMVGSTFFSDIKNLNLIFYSAIGLTYCFVYFTYVGSFKSDHRAYLMKTFFTFGLVISAQVFLYYLNSPDALTDLAHKRINLGWGISNYIAAYLILFIPATAYFIKQSKLKPIYVVAFGLEIVALIFTLSRGGIISFLIISPLIVAYLLHTSNFKNAVISILIFISSLTLFYCLYQTTFETVFIALKTRGLNDSGRFEIWQDAWRIFKANPIFGKGLFARFTDKYHMFHNTIMHTLATMGIVGLIGLILQIFFQFKVLTKEFNYLSFIFFIGLLGIHIHGMVDNIYYMPQFMIIFMILIAVYENLPNDEKPPIELLKKELLF